MNKMKDAEYKKELANLIPGGAHTYSKGTDQFPENVPGAIKKGKGAYVWDMEGKKYLDCSMGLSSVSLGHAYEPIINEVKRELELGVNFQRPSYIEKEMAEGFLDLIPRHDMIKFCKNGSTATTAAVKLARAYTGRELIAFPSDHPFYSYDDWFIGKTESNRGVPDSIKELSTTFKSCDIASLKNLFKEYPDKIAAVIIEPEKPKCYGCNCTISNEEYLTELIHLCKINGVISIIDEMVTGFKTYFPGTTLKYDLDPDLCTWGKGIANGFSFCALTGKKDIMSLGGTTNEGEEKVFLVSTTHGGETHSIRAALKTINEFKKNDVVNYNLESGRLILEGINSLIQKHKLENYISVQECPWLIVFSFKNKLGEICNGHRTFFLQEMLNLGILFQGVFIPCYSHKRKEIHHFLECFNSVLEKYKLVVENGFEKHLIGNQTKPVFRKYN